MIQAVDRNRPPGDSGAVTRCDLVVVCFLIGISRAMGADWRASIGFSQEYGTRPGPRARCATSVDERAALAPVRPRRCRRAARSRRAEASSEGATSTRTPCICSCGSCPPASSADTAASAVICQMRRQLRLRRLGNDRHRHVAPSRSQTLLLLLAVGRFWHHGRTLAAVSAPASGRDRQGCYSKDAEIMTRLRWHRREAGQLVGVRAPGAAPGARAPVRVPAARRRGAETSHRVTETRLDHGRRVQADRGDRARVTSTASMP